MSMTIGPALGNDASAIKPKKNIFGTSQQRAFNTDDSRVGVYQAKPSDGLEKQMGRVAKGDWYKGTAELASLFESYCRQITGDKIYKRGAGAKFGFLGQLARRLPAPILFDDPEIAEFIFKENKPTACVDTSGRMWMHAGFFEECMLEEARDKTMVLPLFLHEYFHIALNHTRRMHNFPPDVSNIAKDKVINPMAKGMFSPNTSFSIIFSEAHGNAAQDQKYAGLSEETIGKMILQERRKALEELGTIRIKNLIIVDGPVKAITTLKAGRDEIKEFDTITVNVQDMGMMDKIDHVFECASLEIDNIDNRLKTRKRPGMGGGESSEQKSPIVIPVESDNPSAGDGKGKPSKNPDGKVGQAGEGSDSDDGRKDLAEVLRDQASKAKGKPSPGQAGGADAGKKDPSDGTGIDSEDKSDGAGTNPGPGRDDPAAGSKVGSGSGNLKGSPSDVLGGLLRTNPLDAPQGHELDLGELNDWLKNNNREDLSGKMRMDDFTPEQVERAIDVALEEAEKERLIIGSGYAGAHVNDYMNTVVRPNSVYKVHWERVVQDFLQGQGTNLGKTLDEYGIYSYINPEDIGMPPEEGIYYEASVPMKPEERFGVISDTSGSVWIDKKRMGHFMALAVGIAATDDEMAPSVDIVGADTTAGNPKIYDAATILEAIVTGVPLSGGGGTDFTTPINQLLLWAKQNDIKYQGLVYITDFEAPPPRREDLPEDMPPLLWVGMPHDYAKAQAFIEAVSVYSQVIVMEDDINIDFRIAQERALANAGRGHSKLADVGPSM